MFEHNKVTEAEDANDGIPTLTDTPSTNDNRHVETTPQQQTKKPKKDGWLKRMLKPVLYKCPVKDCTASITNKKISTHANEFKHYGHYESIK